MQQEENKISLLDLEHYIMSVKVLLRLLTRRDSREKMDEK